MFHNIYLLVCVSTCTPMYVGTCATACVHVRKPEEKLWESVLPFSRVDPRDWAQVVSVSAKRLYQLSYLSCQLVLPVKSFEVLRQFVCFFFFEEIVW